MVGAIVLVTVLTIFLSLIFFVCYDIARAPKIVSQKFFVERVGDEDGELFYVTTPDGEVRID